MEKMNLDIVRPNVLLLGNGVCEQRCSWGSLVEKISEIPTNGTKDVPFWAKASTTKFNDAERHATYRDFFENKYEYEYSKSSIISKLLNLDIDTILTTNFTYEVENAIKDNYSNLKVKKNYAFCTAATADAKYLIHTYNKIENKNIWHIHGEVRRPSSVIFTLSEYGILLSKIKEFVKLAGNKYVNHYDDLLFESWIDYILMGNVYSVGFGMDFSEFDLWWLLERRKREKAKVGKFIFYLPVEENSSGKFEILKRMDVEVRTLGFDVKNIGDSEKDAIYKEFYKCVIEDIKRDLTGVI